MNEVDKLVEKLNHLGSEEHENWSKGILPGDFRPYEEAIRPLVRLFKNADSTRRKHITSVLTSYAKDKLVAYAAKMSTLSVRRESRELLVDGLVALAIEAGTSRDWRGSIAVLSLLHPSTVKVVMD